VSIKKSLFQSLDVGAAPALIRTFFAKTGLAKSVVDSAAYEAIDAYVEQHMRRLNIPGVSLAIVEGDQIVHLRGFGQARPGGEAPSPQTPFVLGSTTKSFTALAVMQLVEAGKIDLDAPVQRYLPWFRVADPQASAHMTVRHLLYQTSGLPGLPGVIVLADLDGRPGAAERQARALSTLKLSRPAGAAFEYSNTNYILLGLIIEAASGEPYAEYIQHHIFDPLGMRHSYTSQALAKQNGLALGHRYWFAFPFAVRNLPIPLGSQAAGQLISSAEDMAATATRTSSRAPVSTSCTAAGQKPVSWESPWGSTPWDGSSPTSAERRSSGTAATFPTFLPIWRSFHSRRKA
jgi:CubicO group peptidase (beta-lactamase class C family)